MSSKPSHQLNALWRLGWAMAAGGAWTSLAWLLAEPSEAASSILLGYSAPLLALGMGTLLPALLFTWLTWRAWRSSSWLANTSLKIQTALKAATRFWILLAGLVVVLFFSWIFFFIPIDRAISLIGSYSLYLARLKPLFFFGVLSGIVFCPLLILQRYGLEVKALVGERELLRPALIIFALLLLVWGLLLVTGLGLGFDATIWNAPGAPQLSSQVFLSLLLTPLLLAIVFALRKNFPKALIFVRLDLFVAVLVWLVAAALWLQQPAQPTYYSSAPRPPNFESYPLSDAFNHDVIANNILIGQGFHFGGLVAIRRPLYVMFLAGLEGALGPNYDLVVSTQVVLLAFFPALLYLLCTKLHNRFSGLLLAGLITFRETNSIALGHVINTSHARLLMADLPTALAMAALGLAAVVWLRGSPRNRLAALLTGGLLGAFILLRSQTLTLIPFFVLLTALVWGWRAALRPALFLMLGIVIVASPWIIRNHIGMGQWAIEDSVVSGFLANRYRFDPGTFGLPFLPSESEGEYYARQMASVRQFAMQNPGYLASFVADNFVRNQLLNFMALPVSWQLRDLESHVRQLPYWPSWDGHLATESALPMLANLFLVALGLAVAWRQLRWVGMAPLFINLGFTLNLALARVSGWRYNLPVDWTVMLYYASGIGQLFVWGMLVLRGPRRLKRFLSNFQFPAQTLNRKRLTLPDKGKWAVSLLVLAILGNSFLMIEALSHPRYQKVSAQEAAAIFDSAVQPTGSEEQRTQIKEMLAQNYLDILIGRALYPAFYRAGEGIAGGDFVLTQLLDFKRVTFYLVGPEAASVVLRVDRAQIVFPSGSDVLVLRCGSDAPEAAAIVVSQSNRTNELFISADLTKACPELDS